MAILKILIVCGGNSGERDVSIKSGRFVYDTLDRLKYEVTLCIVEENLDFVDADSGSLINLYSTTKGINHSIKNKFDLVFMAMPGTFGEDGQLQSLIELSGIPYTHSGILASAITMDKAITLSLMNNAGILIPKTAQFNSSENISKNIELLENQFEYPFFIKPNSGGSSLHSYKIVEQKELVDNLQILQKELPNQIILAQELIIGRELTCPVLGNYGSEYEAMSIGEIITGADFFDYNAKYNDASTQEIFPAKIDYQIEKQIEKISILAHMITKCDGLTRSDFILTAKNELYFIEINTNPGLTKSSLVPKSAKITFGSVSKLLDKIINLAKEKWKIDK